MANSFFDQIYASISSVMGLSSSKTEVVDPKKSNSLEGDWESFFEEGGRDSFQTNRVYALKIQARRKGPVVLITKVIPQQDFPSEPIPPLLFMEDLSSKPLSKAPQPLNQENWLVSFQAKTQEIWENLLKSPKEEEETLPTPIPFPSPHRPTQKPQEISNLNSKDFRKKLVQESQLKMLEGVLSRHSQKKATFSVKKKGNEPSVPKPVVKAFSSSKPRPMSHDFIIQVKSDEDEKKDLETRLNEITTGKMSTIKRELAFIGSITEEKLFESFFKKIEREMKESPEIRKLVLDHVAKECESVALEGDEEKIKSTIKELLKGHSKEKSVAFYLDLQKEGVYLLKKSPKLEMALIGG